MDNMIQSWSLFLAPVLQWSRRLLSRRVCQCSVQCSVLLLVGCLTACTIPQVRAEDRLFVNLSLDFLGAYDLPKLTVEDTPVGGLSGITYDRQRDRFYAISDDRSEHAPARFYTLKTTVKSANGAPKLEKVEVETVTILKGEDGQPFAEGTIDLEGIGLTPGRSLFISSEGVAQAGIPPFVGEFDLMTGQLRRKLPIPDRFLPRTVDGQPMGVQNNLGFEALTINANGSTDGQLEPFRLFTATESALQQDLAPGASTASPSPAPSPVPSRFLHYLIGSNQTTLISEHLYLVEPPIAGANRGLCELLTLDQGGHFLSLERSFGATTGFGAESVQITAGGATDTSGIPSLKGDWSGITPIYKRSQLDLATLGIPLDNLEGMALGARLPDGTQSLLLVSDDNFNDAQRTQFLLFRLRR
jgi:hypothetical protein